MFIQVTEVSFPHQKQKIDIFFWGNTSKNAVISLYGVIDRQVFVPHVYVLYSNHTSENNHSCELRQFLPENKIYVDYPKHHYRRSLEFHHLHFRGAPTKLWAIKWKQNEFVRILHQLILQISLYYLQGFMHPRWCGISSISRRIPLLNSPCQMSVAEVF